MPDKIAAITFGCKVNQYETACILSDFEKSGYEIVQFNQIADLYLINSCTVTGRTDYKSRNAIRQALKKKQERPDTKVIVTGCYAQRNFTELQAMNGIDHIIDNGSKHLIADIIRGNVPEFKEINTYSTYPEQKAERISEHTRAFLKIQDGCDFFCAYCAVPYGRGIPRSRTENNIIQQIKILIGNGYREIVLGGVNLGLYGRDTNTSLYLLLQKLVEIKDLELIRLSSLEPQFITTDLIGLIAENDKIAPHLHIPLQSGCDALLKKMNRRYTVRDFAQLTDTLYSKIPDLALGLDIIAGLPGESDDQFRETEDFLFSLSFTYLHVFPYSRRPGTLATQMNNQVRGEIVKLRGKILLNLSEDKKEQYCRNLISAKILLKGVLEEKKNNYWTALSDHYIRIYLKERNYRKGQLLNLLPKMRGEDGLIVDAYDRNF